VYFTKENNRRDNNPEDVSHMSEEEQRLLNDYHPDFPINSHIKPQQTNVFSTTPGSKGSINSVKLLDTGPEHKTEENDKK
ncbi:hypothetical protein BB558_007124, partial [Smittium angustum]